MPATEITPDAAPAHSGVLAPIDVEALFLFLAALNDGDFSVTFPTGQSGRAGEVARVLNALARRLESVVGEAARVVEEIGTEGRLGAWADVMPQAGQWKRLVDATNAMAVNVTRQTRDLTRTLRLLADGDASRRATARGCQGEALELQSAVNAVLERAGVWPAAGRPVP